MTLMQRMRIRGGWAFSKGYHCVPGNDVYWRIVGKMGYDAARDWRIGWIAGASGK